MMNQKNLLFRDFLDEKHWCKGENTMRNSILSSPMPMHEPLRVLVGGVSEGVHPRPYKRRLANE